MNKPWRSVIGLAWMEQNWLHYVWPSVEPKQRGLERYRPRIPAHSDFGFRVARLDAHRDTGDTVAG